MGSYLVLARKYRPQTFEEVVKQDHVTRTLQNAISANRVAHAVLFSGPRGTGKTTIARILAKAMNCEQGPTPIPCNQCRSCKEITYGNSVDVIEIDGASNTGVDNIRELRDNVKYMPVHSPYKIYIIDEVHMLSVQAFNALLKTLEEPPPHVMFLFATTEPHKIPITILSRCQRHDLRRIDLESIMKHLSWMCEQERIEIEKDGLALIAKKAGGSMRDSLSLLDQVITCTEGTIASKQVLDILGIMDRRQIFDISSALFSGDILRILDIIENAYFHGHNIREVYSELVEHFRNLLVIKLSRNAKKLVDVPEHEMKMMAEQAESVSEMYLSQVLDILFREENSLKYSTQTRHALEMIFIRLLQIKPVLSIDVLIEKLDTLKKDMGKIPEGYPLPLVKEKYSQTLETPSVESKPFGNPETSSPKISEAPARVASCPKDTWQAVVDTFSEKKPSLAAALSKCAFKALDGDNLEIETRLNSNMITKNLQLLENTCRDLFGKPVKVNLICKENDTTTRNQQIDQRNQLQQEAMNHPMVMAAMEIFNGTIVDIRVLS